MFKKNKLINWLELYGQQGIYLEGKGINDIVPISEITKMIGRIKNIKFSDDENAVTFSLNNENYIINLI